MQGESKTSAKSHARSAIKLPTYTVSEVVSKGEFSIKFSESMNLEAFKNLTYDSQSSDNATSSNDSSNIFKYLLSEKHLLI